MRATLEEMERKMQSIARLVGNMVPDGWGFAVLCFSYGENGFMNWVSNAKREDMIRALREMATKLETDRRDFHRTPSKEKDAGPCKQEQGHTGWIACPTHNADVIVPELRTKDSEPCVECGGRGVVEVPHENSSSHWTDCPKCAPKDEEKAK